MFLNNTKISTELSMGYDDFVLKTGRMFGEVYIDFVHKYKIEKKEDKLQIGEDLIDISEYSVVDLLELLAPNVSIVATEYPILYHLSARHVNNFKTTYHKTIITTGSLNYGDVFEISKDGLYTYDLTNAYIIGSEGVEFVSTDNIKTLPIGSVLSLEYTLRQHYLYILNTYSILDKKDLYRGDSRFENNPL
jgi:hypothetical protein